MGTVIAVVVMVALLCVACYGMDDHGRTWR